MATMLQDSLRAVGRVTHVTLARGTGWGMIGGLAGTIVMNLIIMGVLSIAGLPALSSFSNVGDTAARFFSILGLGLAGGVPTGVATIHLIGTAIGAIFGAAVARVEALRVDTLKKCLVLAVLYVEILSQPLFALMPLLLDMTASDTLQWYAGSLVMHFIWGIVLGVIVGHGLGLDTAEKHK